MADELEQAELGSCPCRSGHVVAERWVPSHGYGEKGAHIMRYRWKCPACENAYLLDDLRWPGRLSIAPRCKKLDNLKLQATTQDSEINGRLDDANPYLKESGFTVEQKLAKTWKQDASIAEAVTALAALDDEVKKQAEEMPQRRLPEIRSGMTHTLTTQDGGMSLPAIITEAGDRA